jgi:ketosteroid isomerase-like protein
VDIVEILEGHGHVAAVAEVEMAVDGQTVKDRQVHLFDLRDGRIISVHEYHGDEHAFERLFGGG